MRRAFGPGLLLAIAACLASVPSVAAAAYTPAFTAGAGATTGVEPIAVTTAHLDADADPDALAVNLSAPGDPGSVSVRLGTGDGGFTVAATVTVGAGPTSIATGDFNGDGDTDFVTANVDADSLSVRLGAGDGTFASAPDVALSALAAPSQVAAGDFDADGKLDLVIGTDGSSVLAWLKGAGDGTFAAPVSFGATLLPKSLATGDFDGDGALDIAVADADAGAIDLGSVRAYLGNGNGTFSLALSPVVQDSVPRWISVGDVDSDGALDLVVANASGADPIRAATGLGDVSVHLGRGDGLFDPAPVTVPVDHPIAAELGDLTHDGAQDLAVVSGDADLVYAFVGDGAGGFGNGVSVATGASPSSLAIEDLDANGGGDLLTTDQVPERVGVAMNASALPLTTSLATVPASPNGANGWFKTTPTAQIARGAAGLTYAARNATATAATTPSAADPLALTVAEGTNRYTWFSVSSAEATEPLQAAVVKVDTQAPTSLTNAASAWASATVEATFTASDAAGGSGLDHIEYSVGGAAAQTYTGTAVPISAEGVTTLERAALDVAGNRETSKSVDVRIDLTKPTADLADVPVGWQADAVSVTLSGSDALSGVAALRYRLNSGAVQTTALGNITVSAEGTNTVEYWSVDNAGNESVHQTAQVLVDKFDPTVSASGFSQDGWQREATVTINAVDAGSGIRNAYYQLDAGAVETYTAAFKVTKEGTSTVDYWAYDRAGRISSVEHAHFKIDSTPPTLEATVAASYDYRADILLRGADALSGMYQYEWRMDGGAPVFTGSPNVAVTAPGRHTLTAVAIDAAGNRSATKTWVFYVRTKAKLSTPSAGTTSLRRGRAYTFRGTLSPKHAWKSGLVRVYIDRKVKGVWKPFKSFNAKITQASTYTKYSATCTFSTAGSYRLRVGHSDTYHVPSYSGRRYVTVR